MNIRNVKENPEKMEKKGDAPEEKGEKKEGAMKKFGRYFVATTAIIATLGLAGCKALDSTGRSPLDIDSTSDTSSEGVLDGIEDLDGETDVPEDTEMDAVTDVPEDTEMDSEEDVVSDVEDEDVESDVSEDTVMDSSEDVVSEDVMGEDVESEDVLEEDTTTDTSVDTGVDPGVDTIPDVSVDDVVGDDVITYCDPIDASRSVYMGVGHTTDLGGIGTRYNGTDSSGNALFDILCGGVVVRSLSVAEGVTHMENVSEHSFRVTLNPSMVTSTHTRVAITVDAY